MFKNSRGTGTGWRLVQLRTHCRDTAQKTGQGYVQPLRPDLTPPFTYYLPEFCSVSSLPSQAHSTSAGEAHSRAGSPEREAGV